MAFVWKKIVCPVDFSEESRAALRVATDLAARFGSELTLFHADPEVRQRTAEPAEAGGDFSLAHWKSEAERLGAQRVATEGVRGDPRTAIVEYAQANGFDLVVMGTHGRTGRERQLIGSVAENVVRSSRVPVLTVHADFDRTA